MTQQLDWVGAVDGRPEFRDIRNQRPSVAQEKAELSLKLGRLCNAIPPHIKTGGSINNVKEWQSTRATSAKVAANKRASVAELTAAINNMSRFFRGGK